MTALFVTTTGDCSLGTNQKVRIASGYFFEEFGQNEARIVTDTQKLCSGRTCFVQIDKDDGYRATACIPLGNLAIDEMNLPQ